MHVAGPINRDAKGLTQLAGSRAWTTDRVSESARSVEDPNHVGSEVRDVRLVVHVNPDIPRVLQAGRKHHAQRAPHHYASDDRE